MLHQILFYTADQPESLNYLNSAFNLLLDPVLSPYSDLAGVSLHSK